MNKLNIEYINMDSITPYARNAKKHPKEQVSQIASSIKEFGFNVPIIIDEKNVIRAGHGRYLAAQKLNYEVIPAIKIEHLTEAQLKAFTIIDNQLTMNSDFELDLLKLEMDELDINAEEWGIELPDIDPNFSPGTEDEQGKLDELEPKIVKCPHCKEMFDLNETKS